MKAAVYTKYGPPDVVGIREIPMPVPGDNEILIKVFSSAVTRTDSGFRSAEYFISRFWTGLFRPRHHVMGCVFAGVIEATGKNATLFMKGDKVFGFNDKTFGGHGEYLTLNEKEAVTTIPPNMNFDEAAALTEGAHYALNAINASKIEKGQPAMVYGATGAIGSAAVQILRHLEVKVTAVCNTKNIELIRALGAEIVIDYQTRDFTRTDTKYHFIFDAVGKSSFRQCKPLLVEKGVYISTELGKNAENVFLALATPFSGGKRVLFPVPVIKKQDVIYIKELAEKGAYKPLIDRYYSLNQIVEAYKYVETGQKTGNVVLRIVE